MKGVAYMDKKLSELTVREALALITVLAKAFGNKSTGGSGAVENYQSALRHIDEQCDAKGYK